MLVNDNLVSSVTVKFRTGPYKPIVKSGLLGSKNEERAYLFGSRLLN